MTKLEKLEIRLSNSLGYLVWIFKKSGKYYIQRVDNGSFNYNTWFKTLGQIEDYYNLADL